MNTNESKITTEEAESALASVEGTNLNAQERFRNPPGKNAIISVCFGIFSCAVAFDGSTAWNYIAGFLTLLFTPILIIGFFYMRRIGVKVNLIPHSFSGKVLSMGMTVFFIVVMLGAEILYVAGFFWAPYAAGVANAVVYSISMWKAPLGEWVSRGNLT